MRTTLFVFLIACASAAHSDNTEWRAPTAYEIGSSKSHKSVSADFDGDSKPDIAHIRVSKTGKLSALFVSLSSRQGAAVQLGEPLEASTVSYMGVAIVPPGKYLTVCGKGYMDCKPGEAE